MSEFDHLPARTRIVAAALGCEVGAIASSLVFSCGGEPILVMASGRHRVDLTMLAAHLDDRPVVRATPDQVRMPPARPSAASRRSGIRRPSAPSSTWR